MIRQIRTFTLRLIAAINIAIVVGMLITGYSAYINPLQHPTIVALGITFPFFLIVNLVALFFWVIFKLRYATIPIIGYVLAYIPISIYIPLNVRAAEPEEGCIKVLSYNVMSYAGTPRYNDAFDIIYNYIADSGADIVCLQETNDTWRRSIARFHEIYEYIDTTNVSSNQRNTIMLLSHYPIIRKERIHYPSQGNGSVAYFLAKETDTLLVINNHFETNHFTLEEKARYKEMITGEMENDTARAESRRIIHKLRDATLLRAPQARIVHDYISEHTNYPMIVCGDFNDNPISYTRRIVSKNLTDCFVETGLGLGISYNQNGFFVRIDNILCSRDITPYQCKVDDKIDASDHYPIHCSLKIGHEN